MRLKLGNNSAVVALLVSVRGREDAVMRTLLKGYVECFSAFAYHAFEALHKLSGLPLFLLDITNPIFLPCTNDHLL